MFYEWHIRNQSTNYFDKFVNQPDFCSFAPDKGVGFSHGKKRERSRVSEGCRFLELGFLVQGRMMDGREG